MSLKDAFAGMKPGSPGGAPKGPVPVHRPAGEGKAATAPGHLLGVNAKFQELTEEVAELRKGKGATIRVPIALCDDGDHHPYPLDLDRVADLVPSLRANGQSSPAVLMPKEDGRFLVIVGRHRKHALLEIGESEWDAVLRTVPQDRLKRVAFYDNLLAPQLSDYEKYQGLKKLRKEEGMTLERIAEESGLSKSSVHRYMRFGDLPKAAIAIVEKRHKAFTAVMADQLAQMGKDQAERVVEAFQKVYDEEMSPTQAVAWAKLPPQTASKPAAPTFEFKSGKKTFARMVVRESTIAVQLGKGISPELVKDAIQVVLAQKASEFSGD